MKQITWIYLVLIGLSVAFAAVSLFIVLFGDRPALVSKKLRVGSLIISFNFMLAGCYASKDARDPITCYSASTGGSDCSTDKPGGSDTALPIDSASEGKLSTDIECYVMPPDSDTATAVDTEEPLATDVACYVEMPDSDTGTSVDTGAPPDDTDVMCYEIVDMPTDSDQEPASDSDDPLSYDTETECYDPPPETDIECYDCYDLPMETDIECYVAPDDFPTDEDSESGPSDQDAGPAENTAFDVEKTK